MRFTKRTSHFLRDWLVFSVAFSAMIFLFDPSAELEAYLLKLAMVSVGVLIAYMVTRWRKLVEYYFFRGLLVIVMVLCIWLPSHYGASDLVQDLVLICGIVFGVSSAGYKTDFLTKSAPSHSSGK